MRLEGKVALITGAGSGIGRAMALRFAKEGAKLVASDWNEETLDALVAELKGSGAEVHGVQANVADQSQAEAMVQSAIDNYGRLDILVNNAGVMDNNQGIAELDDDLYRRVMSINVDGPVFATRVAVRQMVKQGGGAILNVASVAAVGGGAAGVAYTMSKHAVVGLTKSTAFIYSPEGVRCNALIVGGVETNIMGSVDMSKMDPYGSARIQAGLGAIPPMLQAEDISNVALFLVSDEAKRISGALVAADGGWKAA